MSGFWSILWVFIWIAIAFWPARVAGRKGHSFIGFFIFSLLFFPAALIGAYIVRDRRCRRCRHRDAARRRATSLYCCPAKPPTAAALIIVRPSLASR
jgi:hypothetical protein